MTAPTHVSTNLQEVLEQARQEARKAREVRHGTPPPKPRRERTGGRPTRLHPDLQARIVRRIQAGSFQETAAMAEGVPSSTYHSWKARGLEARAVLDATGEVPSKERIFLEFLEAIEGARASVEATATEAIQRLALGGEVLEVEEKFDEDGDLVIGRTIRYSKPDGPSLRWFLSKGFAHHWGDKVEISGPDGAGIPVEVEVSARDLLRDAMSQVAERIGAKADDDEEAGDE